MASDTKPQVPYDQNTSEELAEGDFRSPNCQFWVVQIEAAKKAAEDSWRATDNAWSEYLRNYGTKKINRNREVAAKIPIFWSSVRTIQPALYSRTPTPVAEKNFDNLNDNVARVACLCLERLSKYLMRCTPFDRVMSATRDDYIMGGKATNRVCFEAKTKEKRDKKYYKPVDSVDEQGQPMQYLADDDGELPEEGLNLLTDQQGSYSETISEELDYMDVQLLPVHYRDILHTPNARHWEELEWVAFKSMMTKAQVRERFGDEVANVVPYRPYTENAQKGSREKQLMLDDLPTLFATIWEIWDKDNKKVYWYAEGYNQELIDVKDDPYDLIGFFPCPPFLLGTVGPDSLYAVPDFVQLEPFILQCHGIFNRLRTLIRASRRRGIYNAAVEELRRLETDTDEAEFIGVAAFNQLVGPGGIKDLVHYFPVDEITEAITQLSQTLEMYEQKFNELWHIPDLLRGTSDPNDTAAAQQLKGQFISLSFSAVQRDMQRLCRDSIELQMDLALKMLPDSHLAEIMGVQYMKPEEQQLIPQVFQVIKNDTQRMVRIDIETDSTITMNENAEIEQRNYLAKTLFEGLQGLSDLAANAPEMLPVAAETILYTIRGVRDGKQIEEGVRQGLTAWIQKVQQPQQQQPDPKMLDAQTKQQQLQIDAQQKSAQMQLDAQKMQMDFQLGQAKLQMQNQDLQLKGQSLLVELKKIDASAANDQQKTALEAQIAAFENQLKAMELQLDKQYLQLDMGERIATEQRLQEEAETNKESAKLEAISTVAEAHGNKPAPSVVNINVPPKPQPVIL